MEINDLRAQLEKSSKRAGLLSMVGVLVVVAALVVSFYIVNRKVTEIQALDSEIHAKKEKLDEINKQLDETQKTFGSYQDVVKNQCPAAANEAIQKTVEKIPEASKIILDVTSKNAPGSVPPPANARVAFVSTNNVMFREKPDLNATPIDVLKKGQTIYFLDYSENYSEWRNQKARWAHIQTENGKQGWVFEPFVVMGQNKDKLTPSTTTAK